MNKTETYDHGFAEGYQQALADIAAAYKQNHAAGVETWLDDNQPNWRFPPIGHAYKIMPIPIDVDVTRIAVMCDCGWADRTMHDSIDDALAAWKRHAGTES